MRTCEKNYGQDGRGEFLLVQCVLLQYASTDFEEEIYFHGKIHMISVIHNIELT